jgi:hypothetical protein
MGTLVPGYCHRGAPVRRLAASPEAGNRPPVKPFL